MTHITPFLRYLAIPSGYGPTEGLRWSKNGEAIEMGDGRTFIMTAILPPFLEGFASQRPLTHIVYILDFLHLLGYRDDPWYGISSRLSQTIQEAFRTAGKPLRNAGTFFGAVCQNVSPASLPGNNDLELAKWLSSTSLPGIHGWENPEQPPYDAATFRPIIVEKLKELSEREIRHWFRFGRAPLAREGQQLAEEIVHSKPPADRGTLEDVMRDRPRLAGALPFVSTMVSAISFPPRRRTPAALPLGGYADVTNRGDPERLLLSQFALDGDEFVRRFAEKELLFFRREEPHQRVREQLVLLVDQGVRTWGVVRLALSAAVLAFRKIAKQRKLAFFIRFGSVTERIDPSEVPMADLAEHLEASDLTANPSSLLDAEVSEECDEESDIVLLTHPLSLVDERVRTSAASIPERQRLFALTVNEDGSGEFSRLRGGEATAVCRYRVDFRSTEMPPVRLPAVGSQWTGDVEPVPFPFPVGPFQNIVALGFDADSRYLLAATRHGYLHLWNLESGKLETLPRAVQQQIVLTVVDGIMGLNGGFVVGGRIENNLVAAHYDIRQRRLRLHRLGPAERGATRWYALPEQNAVAVRRMPLCRGLDLDSGAQYAEPERVPETSPRAHHAYLMALQCEIPPPQIPVYPVEGPAPQDPSTVCLFPDHETGELFLRGGNHPEKWLKPIANGKLRFKSAMISQALCCGGTLAIRSRPEGEKPIWHLLDNDDAANVREIAGGPDHDSISTLSPDGRLFAHLRKAGEIAVHRFPEGDPKALVTSPGKLHTNIVVQLGRTAMTIALGRKRHLLSWKEGPLQHSYEHTDKKYPLLSGTGPHQVGARHPFTEYDPNRFATMASNVLDVFIDLAGQVIVFDPMRDRLVCIFKIRRRSLAAWLPDGTWYGPSDMIGGPADADALQRLGAALRQASLPMEA